MRFTHYLNPQTSGAAMDGEIIHRAAEQALIADEAGFCAVFVTEHHFTNFNTYSDPFVFGGYLAGQLRNAHLGISVAVVPMHNPIRLVEQINLLDQLTKGRSIFGLAPGGSPVEAAGLGRSAADRHTLMADNLKIMLRAWEHTDGTFDYSVDHETGSIDGRVMPGPYRGRPLLARATHTDETVTRFAKMGWPVMFGRFTPEDGTGKLALYRDALLAADHPAEVVAECLDWVAVTQMVHVAETDEQAWAEAKAPLDQYLAFMPRPKPGVSSVAKGGQAGDFAKQLGVSTDRDKYIEEAMIVGSPDTVAAKISRYQASGIEHIRTWFDWGYAPTDQINRSQQLFINEVLPRFQTTPLAYDRQLTTTS